MKKITLNDPAELLKLSDEQLEQYYWQTVEEEEQIKAQKDAIKEEFKTRAESKKIDGFIAGESTVTLFQKWYTSKVSLELARELGATKMEEKLDATKLGKLCKSGIKIEGAEQRKEIRITKIKEENE